MGIDTKKTPAIKTRLGLLITTERTPDYFHMRARVVTIGTTAADRQRIDEGHRTNVDSDAIRNTTHYETADTNGLLLDNFTVNSQGNNTDATPRRLYGWEIEYRDVYSIDRRQAKQMADTLTTIDRRLEKLNTKYGPPATFGAYLARVADAIGADALVFPQGTARGYCYRDRTHTIIAIQSGIYQADRLITEWSDPQPEQTAAADAAAE